MKARASRKNRKGQTSKIEAFKKFWKDALDEQMEILKEVRDNLKLFGIAVSWSGEKSESVARRSKASKTSKAENPDKVCKVCGQRGHDARRHRFEKQRTAKVKKAAKG